MLITLVALPDALPSCLQSWEDLLLYANRLSARRGGPTVFETRRWVPGTPVPHTGVVLVPARIAESSFLDRNAPELTAALRHWAAGGAVLGAVCGGVFCLAEAGLLEGRRATTHWSLADDFRRRFPRVKLDPDVLVIDEDDRIIGGGMTAYFEVGLRVIRRWAGAEVALDCAAVFVVDPDRTLQSPFVPAGLVHNETDPVLARAVDWALAQTDLNFGVDDWAGSLALERRTFERRALAAWGFGPAERLRRLKLDRARLLTAGGALTWDQITSRCGYRDPAAFRRLFLDRFGQTPGEYHRRFGAGTVG